MNDIICSLLAASLATAIPALGKDKPAESDCWTEMIVSNVDEQALLVVVFKARVSAGAVKYYAAATLTRIADQLRTARQRAPEPGVDLSALNLADLSALFRKK